MWSIWEIVFEMRMALEGGDRKKKKKNRKQAALLRKDGKRDIVLRKRM